MNVHGKTANDDAGLRLLLIGAHPDDCEVQAGGLAALFRKRGWNVTFVSMTNGDAGHHLLSREALAVRRLDETRAVSERFGIDYVVMDNHDGALQADLPNRERLIRLIRTCRPDLVLTHRPCDYHPDHRYTALLVQDAAFLVSVPLICQDTPALPVNPVFAYFNDAFRKPLPFAPTFAVDIDSVLDDKMAMIHCHASQFYEWLPYLAQKSADVPADETDRRQFLFAHWNRRNAAEPYFDSS